MKKNIGTWRLFDDVANRFRGYAKYGKIETYPEDVFVYRQGDVDTTFYYVLSGLINVSIQRKDGREVTLEVMGPDTMFGEGPAFDGLPRYAAARTLNPSRVIAFDSVKVGQVAAADGQFWSDVLHIAGIKQRVLAGKLEHFASRDPESRIAELLVRLSQMYGVKQEDGYLINTYLTHEQIASLTGNSRVTVTRSLTRMRNEGKLDIVEGYLLLASTKLDELL